MECIDCLDRFNNINQLNDTQIESYLDNEIQPPFSRRELREELSRRKKAEGMLEGFSC